MTLCDVIEYRVADSATTYFSRADIPREAFAGTIYARPFGRTHWGYHSGPFYWDAECERSHADGCCAKAREA